MRNPRSAWLVLGASLVSLGVLATGCGSSGGGGGAGTGGSGLGGSSAAGGQGGATGGTGGAGGAAGGAAGAGGTSAGGAAGSGGGAGSGGSGGAAPMCSTSAECKEAQVSFPANTEPATAMPTGCVGGQCGLVTGYSGSYKTPKTPRSCTEICAASTYEGQAMKCSPSCQTKTINGFGDQGLVFDGADAGPGSVAGLVTYQFSSISGAYEFLQVACAEVPKSKLIKGSNSYTYVSHHCCCVAP